MRIEASAIAMSAAHRFESSYMKEEKLEVWIDAPASNSSGAIDTVNLSIDASKDKCRDATLLCAEDNLPGELLALIRFIEQITGKKFRFLKAVKMDSQTPAQTGTDAIPTGWGVRYDYHEMRSESEQTAFSAQGIVRTADGREIAFNLNLAMSREFAEETRLSVLAGTPRKVDPLVINFDDGAAELTDWSFDFDLNADGTAEAIPFVTQGSGFLVFDRNGDGLVNNGGELFGPSTGNGFAELAGLDQDGNGWIDENDAAFAHLSVWMRSADGTQQLLDLQQSGVGALNAGCVESPFDLKDQSNTSKGQIIRTGIYLTESGRAGTIQQLDLFV